MNNQKGFANIVLIAVIVILVGAVGYFAFVKKSEPVAQQTTLPPANTQTPTPQQSSPTPVINETANWKTYKSDTYSFEVRYPSDWTSKGSWSENGGFFYVGFGDENAIRTKPPAMLRIYPDQSSIDRFKDKVYFEGNWKNTTLGGLPAFETVGMDQTTKRQFIIIISMRGSYGYELESTVFDDTVDIVRTMSSTFKFLK